MSILGLTIGNSIAGRGVPAVRVRAGEHALEFAALFARLDTNARLLSAGSFPWVTQNNCWRFFAAADDDVRAGDLVSTADKTCLLYADQSHSIGGVCAYRAFFALRVNVTDLAFERYRDDAGPAGGITANLKHSPYATGISAHFWKANEATAATADGRTEQSSAFLVAQLRSDIAPGDLVSIDDRFYSFDGFDVRAHDGLVVIKMERVK
jgi:hypothetical protein